MYLAYDLQVFQLGFFWDDWQVVFLSRLDGTSAYWNHFAYDRPLSIWTYLLTVPVLGMRPLLWHLFTLLVRWLSVLGFVWAFSGLWPTRLWQVRWMGLLLAIYPGFSQQPVSVAYSQHFISYALLTFSLGCMIWSVKRPTRYWHYTVPGVLFSLLQLLTMEYFFGLELIRPLILWMLVRNKDEKRSFTGVRVLRYWAPYMLPLILFILSRFVFSRQLFPLLEANPPLLLIRMKSQPVKEVLNLIEIGLKDSLNVGLFAWLQPILPETISLRSTATLFSWALGLASALLVAWGVPAARVRETALPAAVEKSAFIGQGLLIGLAAIFFGGLPIWTTDRMTSFNSWADRFSLPLMLGVVIVVVCVIEWAIQHPTRKTVVLAFLVGIAIAAHFRSIDQYRRHWEIQQSYYQQLVWRVPGLEEGTAILAPELSFSYVGFYSPGYVVNTIYADQPEPQKLPLWWISASRWIGSNVLPSLEEDVPILYTDRNLVFASSTSTTLPVTFNHARGCLRVMDPIYRQAPRMSEYEDDLWALSGHSHMDQILPSGAQDAVLPREIFGRQTQEWCYYFEKADLARQFEDWETVSRLDRAAQSAGFSPQNGTEWIPFIEAAARLDDWETAQQHTLAAAQLTPEMEAALCDTWARILKSTQESSERAAVLAAVQPLLQCRFEE